jgi:hypothetical protein
MINWLRTVQEWELKETFKKNNMGMFDSIWITIKCSGCGKESLMECQTKELEQNLDKFYQGDFIGTDQFKWLWCKASCLSDECRQYEKENFSWRSGFGRMMDVKVFLENGCVTSDYKILTGGSQ